MRTGSPVIVQRGDFVIAGDRGPLQNFIGVPEMGLIAMSAT
jgi:hypothetical protein